MSDTKDLKKLPKEMQEAYKKVKNYPDENTPAIIMNMQDMNENTILNFYSNPFSTTEVVDWVDEKLLDLELDERDKVSNSVYTDFAFMVIKKITWLNDFDTGKLKKLDIYDNNTKVKKLKMKDFATIGNLDDLSMSEKAEKYAEFYGIENDEAFKALTIWKKRLFVAKVSGREDTSVEKK